jgi:protease-4
VEEGRHLPAAVVDSIAQGRVWSGVDAVKLGLVDRLGGLKAAIASAARMAHLVSYGLKEYPVPQPAFERMYEQLTTDAGAVLMKAELGKNYPVYEELRRIEASRGQILARLPYTLIVN